MNRLKHLPEKFTDVHVSLSVSSEGSSMTLAIHRAGPIIEDDHSRVRDLKVQRITLCANEKIDAMLRLLALLSASGSLLSEAGIAALQSCAERKGHFGFNLPLDPTTIVDFIEEEVTDSQNGSASSSTGSLSGVTSAEDVYDERA